MDLEEKIRKRLTGLGEVAIKLTENTEQLRKKYDKFFNEAFAHSQRFGGYLVTWVKLESEMSLNLEESTKKLIQEVAKLSGELTAKTGKSMQDFIAGRAIIDKLTPGLATTMSAISKAFPNAKKCNEEVDKFEAIYDTALIEFQQLQNELKPLQELLKETTTKFSQLNN